MWYYMEREEVSGTLRFRAKTFFPLYHQFLAESGPLARKCSQTNRCVFKKLEGSYAAMDACSGCPEKLLKDEEHKLQ